jgi:hypothetical protein
MRGVRKASTAGEEPFEPLHATLSTVRLVLLLLQAWTFDSGLFNEAVLLSARLDDALT